MNRFDKETIDWILKIRDGTENTLVRRESTKLEFKKNFNSASLCEYGKILLSMANNKGGHIVFGVTDEKPHKLIGMSNDNFENIDPREISDTFDSHFSPMLNWDHHIEARDCGKIGFLYVESSREKPVMCVKPGRRGEYKEGDIYYRYGGKTSAIKSPDLQRIIRARIDNENERWQHLLKNIAKVSPSKVSLLNEESGEFIGDKNVVLVDDKILSKMKFIREGEFNETKGAPAYKMVSDIQDIRGTTIIKEKISIPKLIHREDIINSFWEEKCEYPKMYLEKFPDENTHYLPFWFLIKISDLSIAEVETIWKKLKHANGFIRNKLIDRLRSENVDILRIGKILNLNGNNYVMNINEYDNKLQECKSLNPEKTRSDLIMERSFIFSLINNGCLKHFTKAFIRSKYRIIFEAISNLEKDKIIENKGQIYSTMREIYKIQEDSTNLRKCICYIDCMLNREDVSE